MRTAALIFAVGCVIGCSGRYPRAEGVARELAAAPGLPEVPRRCLVANHVHTIVSDRYSHAPVPARPSSTSAAVAMLCIKKRIHSAMTKGTLALMNCPVVSKTEKQAVAQSAKTMPETAGLMRAGCGLPRAPTRW